MIMMKSTGSMAVEGAVHLFPPSGRATAVPAQRTKQDDEVLHGASKTTPMTIHSPRLRGSTGPPGTGARCYSVQHPLVGGHEVTPCSCWPWRAIVQAEHAVGEELL